MDGSRTIHTESFNAVKIQVLNKIPNFDMLCPVQDSQIMASNNECVTKSTSHANVG